MVGSRKQFQWKLAKRATVEELPADITWCKGEKDGSTSISTSVQSAAVI